MVIKKYQAKIEADAVAQAKKELGQGVVIMNVRNVRAKGFLRFLKPAMVEVTVAMEEEPEKPVAKREMKPEEKALFLGGEPEIREAVSQVRRVAEEAVPTTAEREPAERAIEEKLDNLQSFLEQQLNQSQEEEKEELVEEEKSEAVLFMRLLYNTMLENEVDEKYANQIIDEIGKNAGGNASIDYLLANVYQKMILKFGKPVEIIPAENGPRVLFFVGPTGVGKTTTIAKIASRFHVDEKKKVALLTADTYRIAAAEQLRTYANILETPFRVIYSGEEMAEALKDFADYDYVLVDTAGHSHHNEAQKENMNQFIHFLDDKVESMAFLVLSATTKYRDLVSIAESYQSMVDFTLIFTKLDETTTLGNLLNLRLHTNAPLSYVTCGQNVPDDIERFNPQKTVKQLLGGNKGMR